MGDAAALAAKEEEDRLAVEKEKRGYIGTNTVNDCDFGTTTKEEEEEEAFSSDVVPEGEVVVPTTSKEQDIVVDDGSSASTTTALDRPTKCQDIFVARSHRTGSTKLHKKRKEKLNRKKVKMKTKSKSMSFSLFRSTKRLVKKKFNR